MVWAPALPRISRRVKGDFSAADCKGGAKLQRSTMLPVIMAGDVAEAHRTLDRFMIKSIRRSTSKKNLFSAESFGHSHAHSPSKQRSSAAYMLVWSLLAITAVVSVSLMFPKDPSIHHTSPTMHSRAIKENDGIAVGQGQAAASTLIIYVYSNSDPEYSRNLHFFIKNGMRDGDGCEYLVIVQQDPAQPGGDLPPLPSNAQYMYHANECYDWGTFGWAIKTGKVDTAKYTFIIFMNSSTRGPILAPYWPREMHWSQIYTNKLSDKVKLVGSTISCEPAWRGSNRANEMRQIAHVQSYVIATDQVGLKVLQDNGEVFKCYTDMDDTIFNSELGSSLAIYEAGYSVDSLMLRYQGVDWSDRSNWQCNAGLNPYAEFAYDGIELNPMEVVFVKVKDFLLDVGWVAPTMATTYDRWISTKGVQGVVNSNMYAADRDTYRLPKILALQKRDPACFDFDYYLAKSKDLPSSMTRQAAWDHLVNHGQFEGRSFRFTCKLQLPEPVAAIGGTTTGVAAVVAAVEPMPAVAATAEVGPVPVVEVPLEPQPAAEADPKLVAEAVAAEQAVENPQNPDHTHLNVKVRMHTRVIPGAISAADADAAAVAAAAAQQPGAGAIGGTTLGVAQAQQAAQEVQPAAAAVVVPAEVLPVAVGGGTAGVAEVLPAAQARLRNI
ncbi:hypothetical protein WJX72_001363 [[Myrmecia] bisecta]|uniref:Nucleotide-diphospho-sugar transferase domain-containing protein n=1 Tax=[Myrmecia] bisecta TaxID=41462 RepID=A0AAW1Q2I4_9CHLO